MAHWNITQLTELKVQFLLEKCKVYFKVKYLSRVSISVFWFPAHVYIILFCAFVLVFNPPTSLPHMPQPIWPISNFRKDPSFDRISVCERLPNIKFSFSLSFLWNPDSFSQLEASTSTRILFFTHAISKSTKDDTWSCRSEKFRVRAVRCLFGRARLTST